LKCLEKERMGCDLIWYLLGKFRVHYICECIVFAGSVERDEYYGCGYW